MDKRPADAPADGAAPASKRGRWDAPAPAPGSAAAPGVVPAPLAPNPALAAAAAMAAAVAAKYAPPGTVQPPPVVAGVGLPGVSAAGLTAGAAAAVAQAAAAAMQKLPLAAAGAAAPAARPTVNLEALEKAKKALQLQKEIQEKLKSRLPQLAAKLPAPGAANGAAPVLAPAAAGAPSVRPLLGLPPGAAAASGPVPLTGIPPLRPALPPAAPEPPPEDDPFYDPALARGAGGRRSDRKRRGGFDFVNEGRFQREAELFRMKAHLGAAAFRRGAPRVSGPLGAPSRFPGASAAPPAGMDANLVPLGERTKLESREGTPPPEAEPVPAVEWWDRGLLAHASLDQDVPDLPAEALAPPPSGAGAQGEGGEGDGDAEMGEADEGSRREAEGARRAAAAAADRALAEAAAAAGAAQLGPFQLKEARLTLYVEHPVPLEPPAEAPPPAPQPLKLTAKELKKLRTQRRLARDKERQELIRQGLLEPPKPKVRIANLHRVLGTEGALDPTAVEKEVRKQMAERQAAHDDRNEARKLTPAERREKKLRRLFGSAAVEAGVAEVGGKGKAAKAAAALAAAQGPGSGIDVICSVYRVGRLTDPQHRFKVDANARENHMTGVAVISDDFCVVVVEGVEKATRRYLKLMMRRIDWSTAPAPGKDVGAEEEDDEELPPNVCTLVWQGTVLRRAFPGFRVEPVRSAAAGRAVLEDAGVAHYWDAAAGATEGESVPYQL
ncbi:hypothetical protein HYH03_017539 [Edaphochlamys debaryana]|uniref:Uncharacterized protein n=1 Tax=Edaphochlamys debaryana TaxID=47281 RepID=A0A836BP69_9CHLO|nr:hypothetical protein HYH03_017539 [Edaphochlamys debaryana]|eukprot:KAG2483597.1 hypothetical protein HYH03_017539 [Edaphochlamys debaryana]